jgi:hypothetical protein
MHHGRLSFHCLTAWEPPDVLETPPRCAMPRPTDLVLGKRRARWRTPSTRALARPPGRHRCEDGNAECEKAHHVALDVARVPVGTLCRCSPP